ncbi:MAG: dockerin type I repeat-containing protein, partial [Candidatus Binatia bacterium]
GGGGGPGADSGEAGTSGIGGAGGAAGPVLNGSAGGGGGGGGGYFGGGGGGGGGATASGGASGGGGGGGSGFVNEEATDVGTSTLTQDGEGNGVVRITPLPGDCAPVTLCGDANNDGNITASDALFALSAAVGSKQCSLSVCDANGSGSISAGDALLILKAAVGSAVELKCP